MGQASTSGPPMLPGPYNNNYQIVQTPGYVMILVEQIHALESIRFDGRPHLPSNVRQWMGDSLGRWEGDTLVVDTTNFRTDWVSRVERWPARDRASHTRRRETQSSTNSQSTILQLLRGPGQRVSFLGSTWPDL